jgi:hypothetical protein
MTTILNKLKELFLNFTTPTEEVTETFAEPQNPIDPLLNIHQPKNTLETSSNRTMRFSQLPTTAVADPDLSMLRSRTMYQPTDTSKAIFTRRLSQVLTTAVVDLDLSKLSRNTGNENVCCMHGTNASSLIKIDSRVRNMRRVSTTTVVDLDLSKLSRNTGNECACCMHGTHATSVIRVDSRV